MIYEMFDGCGKNNTKKIERLLKNVNALYKRI